MGRRSRKRSGPGEQRAAASGGRTTTAATAAAKATRKPAPAPAPRRPPRTRAGQRLETRPQPLWHPWPLSEIAIGLGVLIAAYGFTRGSDRGASYIGGGVLMATAGVIELCAREHFSGFKSHTLLLAFLPVVAMHTIVRLWIVEAYEGPVALLLDFAIFGVLSLVLLDRFRRARPQPKGRRS